METICARQNPADLFGASRTRWRSIKSGKRLFVCNGTQNAVAVFDFAPGKSKLLGLIPVGWFPGAVVHDARRRRALRRQHQRRCLHQDARSPRSMPSYNTHQYHGTLSLVQGALGARAGGAHGRRAGQHALSAAAGKPRCRRGPASRRARCRSAWASPASSSTSSISSRRTAPTTRCWAT